MRFGILLSLTLGLFAAGCGSEETGPQRFHVSGEVTFDGKPVPRGTIYFETTSGPPGSAQIIEGHYDTRDGKGVIGGPHQVLIEGYDGQGTAEGELGQPIFNPHRVQADFPEEDTTQNFEVPASAAKNLVISKDPA